MSKTKVSLASEISKLVNSNVQRRINSLDGISRVESQSIINEEWDLVKQAASILIDRYDSGTSKSEPAVKVTAGSPKQVTAEVTEPKTLESVNKEWKDVIDESIVILAQFLESRETDGKKVWMN